MSNWCKKLLFIAGLLQVVLVAAWLPAATPNGDLTYEEIVQKLVARDNLIQSVTMSFSTTSAFPSGKTGKLPTTYEYVYRDDLVYMSVTDDKVATSTQKGFLGKNGYLTLVLGAKQAFIGPYSPWGSRTVLRSFFRVGLQDIKEPLLGKWMEIRSGRIDRITELDGHKVYVLDDAGMAMAPPPNEEAYEIWIVPDYGYAPVRVYEYRSGGLHHLWEYSGLKPQTENLYVPTQAKVWYCSTDKKIKDFDPQTPGNNWGARVDVQIKSFVFNQQEYPDSFFSPEIPNGYYVIDGLEGLTYTAGDPSSRRKVAGGLRDTMKVTSGTVSTSK